MLKGKRREKGEIRRNENARIDVNTEDKTR